MEDELYRENDTTVGSTVDSFITASQEDTGWTMEDQPMNESLPALGTIDVVTEDLDTVEDFHVRLERIENLTTQFSPKGLFRPEAFPDRISYYDTRMKFEEETVNQLLEIYKWQGRRRVRETDDKTSGYPIGSSLPRSMEPIINRLIEKNRLPKNFLEMPHPEQHMYLIQLDKNLVKSHRKIREGFIELADPMYENNQRLLRIYNAGALTNDKVETYEDLQLAVKKATTGEYSTAKSRNILRPYLNAQKIINRGSGGGSATSAYKWGNIGGPNPDPNTQKEAYDGSPSLAAAIAAGSQQARAANDKVTEKWDATYNRNLENLTGEPSTSGMPWNAGPPGSFRTLNFEAMPPVILQSTIRTILDVEQENTASEALKPTKALQTYMKSALQDIVLLTDKENIGREETLDRTLNVLNALATISALTDSKDEAAMARLAGDLGLDYDTLNPVLSLTNMANPLGGNSLILELQNADPEELKVIMQRVQTAMGEDARALVGLIANEYSAAQVLVPRILLFVA